MRYVLYGMLYLSLYSVQGYSDGVQCQVKRLSPTDKAAEITTGVGWMDKERAQQWLMLLESFYSPYTVHRLSCKPYIAI